MLSGFESRERSPVAEGRSCAASSSLRDDCRERKSVASDLSMEERELQMAAMMCSHALTQPRVVLQVDMTEASRTHAVELTKPSLVLFEGRQTYLLQRLEDCQAVFLWRTTCTSLPHLHCLFVCDTLQVGGCPTIYSHEVPRSKSACKLRPEQQGSRLYPMGMRLSCSALRASHCLLSAGREATGNYPFYTANLLDQGAKTSRICHAGLLAACIPMTGP
jgi:hypothetical protein